MNARSLVMLHFWVVGIEGTAVERGALLICGLLFGARRGARREETQNRLKLAMNNVYEAAGRCIVDGVA